MKLLIADAGSTKTDWAYVDRTLGDTLLFRSEGINALLASRVMLDKVMADVLSHLPADADIDTLYYYGAGCATQKACDNIRESAASVIGPKNAEVCSDLLGAARSLCGDRPGIACILGTGSNSCLYDGKNITDNIPPLGFILGDEGSGTAFGKRLLSDAFKREMPENLRSKFFDRYSLSMPYVLENVYRGNRPGKYIARFAEFIGENREDEYIVGMVEEEFSKFFRRNLAPYRDAHKLPVNFTGSIAFHLSAMLRSAAEKEGFSVGNITKCPMDGLLKYHKS